MAPPALIIIDLQNDFVGLSPLIRDAVPRVRRLLDLFRGRGWPVFHVIREYKKDLTNVENVRRDRYARGMPLVIEGTEGQKIVEELRPAWYDAGIADPAGNRGLSPGSAAPAIGNEHILVKPRFSAFFRTGLHEKLIEHGVGTIVVTGAVTPNCVRSTVYDGVSLDYWVVVVEDCCAAEEDDVHSANIRDLRNLGVEVVSLEEFLKGASG